MRFISILLAYTLVSFSTFATAGDIVVSKDKPLHQQESVSQISTFTIDNSMGNVTVHEVQGDSIQLEGTYLGNQSATVEFNEVSPGKVRIQVTAPEPEAIELPEVKKPGFFQRVSNAVLGNSVIVTSTPGITIVTHNGVTLVSTGGFGSLSLKVGIPRHLLAHLKVTTQDGDISLSGAFTNEVAHNRQILLESARGSIDTKNTGGHLQAEAMGDGDISVEQHRGEASVVSQRGSVRVTQVEGNTLAQAKGDGDVRVSGIDGDVTATSQRGEVEVLKVRGTVTANGQHYVRVQEVSGAVEATSQRDSVSISGGTGITIAKALGDGDIEISNRQGNVSATAQRGSIETKEIEGVLRAEALGDGDVSIKNTRGEVVVKAHRGGIEVIHTTGSVHTDAMGDGDIEVNKAKDVKAVARRGSITIEGATGAVEATAQGDGDIHLNNPRASTEDAHSRRGAVYGKSRSQSTVASPADPDVRMPERASVGSKHCKKVFDF